MRVILTPNERFEIGVVRFLRSDYGWLDFSPTNFRRPTGGVEDPKPREFLLAVIW